MNARIKRALWCRWFHRYRMPRHPAPPAVNRDPGGSGQALVMSAGPGRTFCDVCEAVGDRYATRSARHWLTSP